MRSRGLEIEQVQFWPLRFACAIAVALRFPLHSPEQEPPRVKRVYVQRLRLQQIHQFWMTINDSGVLPLVGLVDALLVRWDFFFHDGIGFSSPDN